MFNPSTEIEALFDQCWSAIIVDRMAEEEIREMVVQEGNYSEEQVALMLEAIAEGVQHLAHTSQSYISEANQTNQCEARQVHHCH